MDLKSKIRNIPDFPKKGVNFKDITPLLGDPVGFRHAIGKMLIYARQKNATKIVGIESRGFIFGAALAYELMAGFVPLRKQGKLPFQVLTETYDTEYSTAALEAHVDGISKGDRVIICDDLIATGGSLKAAVSLVENLGGVVVGIVVLIELDFLKGRDKLDGYDILSIVHYENPED